MHEKPRAETTLSDDDASFLQRWSQRKREAAVAESPAASPVADTPAAEAAETETPREELTDADMPPLESLDEHADYSGFFSPKVSAELRRAALRKLFRAPRFNITDGLNDYDEDYRSYTALGEIVTHEMRRMWDREKARLEAQEEATSETETIAETENLASESPGDDNADPQASSPEDHAPEHHDNHNDNDPNGTPT